MPLFADILLPVAIPRPFTYAVPDELKGIVKEGMLVRVPLGKSKLCEGIVRRLHTDAPRSNTPPRPVSEVLGRIPVATLRQMELWEWMAGYYMCTVGEVVKAALPLGIRAGSYTPAPELFVRIASHYTSSEQIPALLEKIRRAQTQCKALLTYLSLLETDPAGEPELNPADRDTLWIKRSLITEQVASSAILKLIERNILEQAERIPGPEADETVRLHYPHIPVTEENSPEALFASGKNTVLCQDDISSPSRAELYTALAARQAEAGKQTLILLPDTFSGQEIIASLQETFAERCVVYHSRTTEHARSAIWHRMITRPGSVDVIVGTRIALFLPYARLGLVAVDNEHEGSYRQSDPAPRYNGRDTALMLASLHQARTLLASATPSIESWQNATSGKYGYLNLPAAGEQAKVTILERGKGQLSKYLQKRVDETLASGKQAVLFQNRRGFAPYIECGSCGTTPLCPHCNVTLTYHKEGNTLQCHYCGWQQPYLPACGSCGMQTLVPRGIGTERIEETAAALFPDTRIVRIDADAVSSAGASKRISNEFAGGSTEILVGTQMVTRTARAGRVGVVGVINGDNMLSHPDFRAAERAFQLLMQLKGVISEPRGELIIQSSQRLHPVLIAVSNHDTAGFYTRELEERQVLSYPPFTRMIRLSFRHPERQQAAAAADRAETLMRPVFGNRVSPPFEPQVDRVQGRHILHILLRIERDRSVSKAKAILSGILARLRKEFSAVRIVPEVDPQ